MISITVDSLPNLKIFADFGNLVVEKCTQSLNNTAVNIITKTFNLLK